MSGAARRRLAAKPSASPTSTSSATPNSSSRFLRAAAGTAPGFLLCASLDRITTSRSPRVRACRSRRKWAAWTRLKQPAAKTTTGLFSSALRSARVLIALVLAGLVVLEPFPHALFEHVDGATEVAGELGD